MKKLSWRGLRMCTALLLGLLWVGNSSSIAEEEIAIVVNSSNPIASISGGDLHRIFLGDKSTWPNSKHIFLVMAPPGSPEREVMLKTVYKMSEAEYSKYFLQAAFTGAVSAPPKDASSAAEIKQLVSGNPGAIGYLKAQDVDGSVKVVLKIP